MAPQHPFNSGSTHFSIMDGELREATWASQARAVGAPVSSSGTVPTMLFCLLGYNVSLPARWIFSSSMSSWKSWIKHLKIITRPELHRLQHYMTFKCCQGVFQRKLICLPESPVSAGNKPGAFGWLLDMPHSPQILLIVHTLDSIPSEMEFPMLSFHPVLKYQTSSGKWLHLLPVYCWANFHWSNTRDLQFGGEDLRSQGRKQ